MKKIAKAIVSMGVVLAFAGCSWQIPQTVSVKTNADYSFSLGNFTNDLGDSMDTTSMMGDAGEGSSAIQTMDYFPGKLDKNTQHYLLEVKILEQNLLATVPTESQLDTVFDSSDTVTLTTFTNTYPLTTITDSAVNLDFNPSTMLSEMKNSFGEDMAGKISFASVPMYMYCATAENLSVDAVLELYYGDDPENHPEHQRAGVTPIDILPGGTLSNKPKPNYQMEGNTVTVNLAEKACIGNAPLEIKSLINNTDNAIQEEDKLCISYHIGTPTGSVTRAEVEAGIPITIYAVIDLPVKFEVSANHDVKLDVSKMSGESDSSSSSSSSSESSSSSGDSEFSKYMNVMDSVSIKYVVYQLPIYAANGMQLWVDLIGDGLNYDKGSDIVFVDKNKTITEADKSTITLKTATIQKMKDTANFNPNFVLFLKRGSVFSLPREKMIDMNLEMSFKTDGTIQVK